MSKWDYSFQLSRLLGPNKQCPGLHCAWGVFVTHTCFLLQSEQFSFYYLFVFHSLCNMSVVFRCFQNNWKTWVWPRNLSWWHVFRRFSAPCGPPMETRSARSMQALVLWMARLRYMLACKTHKQYSTKGKREQKNGCFVPFSLWKFTIVLMVLICCFSLLSYGCSSYCVVSLQ